MGKIHLNVKTVPAFDQSTLEFHTAYTVFLNNGTKSMVASGWTLQDAITVYARIYKCDRKTIRVKRPFVRQVIKNYFI